MFKSGLIKANFAFLCFVIFLAAPFNVFAYDSNYLNSLEYWQSNENASVYQIEDERVGGFFQTFTDYDNSVVYIHLSHSAPVDEGVFVCFILNDDGSRIDFSEGETKIGDITVNAQYFNAGSEICFCVDLKKAAKTFENDTFGLYISSGDDIYTVSSEVGTGILKNRAENTKTTTQKSSKTTKSSKSSTKKATTKKQTTKSQAGKTTKYKYNAGEKTTSGKETSTLAEDENTKNTVLLTENSGEDSSTYPFVSKVLIMAAFILFACGMLLITIYLLKKQNADNQAEKENENTPSSNDFNDEE